MTLTGLDRGDESPKTSCNNLFFSNYLLLLLLLMQLLLLLLLRQRDGPTSAGIAFRTCTILNNLLLLLRE